MFISNPEERLNMEVTQEQYDYIKNLWIKHVTAEAEGKIDVVLSTMTDDCVYEIIQTGEVWIGHEGARKFYDILMKAVPDAEFELLDIVIGPQGVLGVANMKGTQKEPFAGIDQSGQQVYWRLINIFSWDPVNLKFTGERIYSFKPVNN